MFAYCGNNPVSRIDNEGYWWNVVIGAVVGAVIGFASGIVTELVEKKTGDEKTKEFDWGDVWLSTGIDAAEGALTALCPAAAVFISSGASIAETILDGIEDGESVREIAVNSIWARVIGAAGVDEVPFVKGGMVNDAVKSIGNAFLRGVHPCVKKAARTTLINVTRRIGKELFSGMGESIIYGGLHQFVSWYTNEALDRI